MLLRLTAAIVILITFSITTYTQNERNNFKQLYEELPTPTTYRNASGAPGHEYWQQKADYKIQIELDEKIQKIKGEEIITYHNNSKDYLEYLWLQLDQNRRALDSDSYKIAESKIKKKMSERDIRYLKQDFDGGFKIEYVKTMNGDSLTAAVVKTMMRVNLPEPLKPGESFSFKIKYWYNINDRMKLWGRSGYEYFSEYQNAIYTIAQFFPRMAVYNDIDGWQNKQFLGRGEFTLPFGDYEVSIKVPADHIVAATGELQNKAEVLTRQQIRLLEKARSEKTQPILIVTEKEAREKEKHQSKDYKTWDFKANNVRDFAFASSRKFIWDAMGVPMSDGSTVMAMSMYPKEGNPLWEQYSTKVIAHTLKWYSHYTFDYPYPVAWSIHANRIGMEYPMICFNGGRPESDGTYSKRTKYGMIGVVRHEVGHNYFPMIVNSDERQWTWMDEGLNTFIQLLTEQHWEKNYPSKRGTPQNITAYMNGDKSKISPIMTNSESVFQLGNNAYAKTATALNILRETILGRELFDYAFKVYATRWKFKHPSPADFFRTMEDASGIDLDWFWWGWFYTTDHVDLAINDVRWMKVDSKNPDVELIAKKMERDQAQKNISNIRNEKDIHKTLEDIDPSIKDFYSDYDPLIPTKEDRENYQKSLKNMDEKERSILNDLTYFYEITFENIGGLVMPLIVEFEFEDGTKSIERIPAEIWRFNQQTVTKVFPVEKEIKQITLDPYLETADVETKNNYFPQKTTLSRFELFKQQNKPGKNPMQKAKGKPNKLEGSDK